MFAPFVFLILGVTVLVVGRAAHGAKAATSHPPPGTRQIELDRGMAEVDAQRVLSALLYAEDAAQLETLAHELEAKYPIATHELRDRAHALRTATRGGSSATHPHDASTSHTPHAASPPSVHGGYGTPSSRTASHGAQGIGADDGGSEAVIVLQAVAKALAEESDPVTLEGFGESIRAKYPTAASALVLRAQQLREAEAALQATAAAAAAPVAAPPAAVPSPPNVTGTSPPVATGTSPAPIASSATPPSSPAAYVVHAGDTPALIAERLVQDSQRWPELVSANPHKPKSPDGNFASLTPGESLALPSTWASSATALTTLAAQPRVQLPMKEAHT